ncbi:inositol polyphosphate multikinase [Aspergillus glaucus CBS 516.65]|uniref:Kinase n=1 Tax=Aspergillus glaucus CBS 516.65 TaxID=1160497 RepID=A0A1L9V6K9_ASPGL|nr:hypothetical protein ASPGLDRAFT_180835 [Aspergillus glaucus CBS 516.65]OJJ79553.1 hypothetical protein ASPGLDRAFT_180835 [Aspergillus glaucus CBS 516.65]
MPSPSKSETLEHDNFVAFDHAAAGHDGVRCTLSGSLIAKPCTSAEVEFYESCALHPLFRELIPTYIGTLSSADDQQQQQQPSLAVPAAADTLQSDSTGTPTEKATSPYGRKIETELSIVLENVAAGFKRPNVLDVKLGARLWADDARPEKRAKLDAVSQETTSSSLGFRICGMKVFTGEDGESDEGALTDPYDAKHEGKEGEKGEVIEKDGFKRYDKWYGRSFNEGNVKEGFEAFFTGAKLGGVDRSKLVARRVIEELKRVQKTLEMEESRMYSASVLIVYEGDPEALEHALEEEKKALDKPPTQDDEEDEDEEVSLEELQQDGSLQLVDVNNLGQAGIPQQAINIPIDPSTVANLGDEDDDEEDAPKVHDLRLIDFAHAQWTPGQGHDENSLRGVRNLIKVLNGIVE